MRKDAALRFAVGSSIFSLAVCAGAAEAQTLPPPAAAGSQGATPAEGGLQEIVVTAQKRSENLQKVPIAVSVASGVQLKNAAVSGATGLTKFVPSLAINSGQGFFAPYIRGVGSQYSSLGFESSIASYENDIYLSRPEAGYADFLDVARVEVLEGPQGTLFGRNATGGTIRVITNDPVLQKWQGEAAFTYGRFNRIGGEGVLNIPMGDISALRIAYYHDQRDGYITNTDPTKRDLANRDEDIYRATWLMEPSDKFKAKLFVEYSHKDDDEEAGSNNPFGAPGQTAVGLGGLPAPGFYKTTADDPYSGTPPWLIEQLKSELKLDYNAGPATISSISSYVYSNFNARYTELDATNIPYEADTYHEHSKSYSEELQAVSNFSGPFKIIGGLYYFRELGSNDFALFGQFVNDTLGGIPYGPNIGQPGGGPTLNSQATVRTTSLAPYAQATYDFTDKLQLLVGVRYTWEKKVLVGHDNTLTYLPTDPGGVTTTFDENGRDLKFHKFTPRVTLSYKPAPGIMFYGTFSEGFKSGGFNTTEFGPSDSVKPEDLKNFELGWKTEFGKFRINGDGFYYNYKNLQVQTTDTSTGGTFVENAAAAKIYGAEFNIDWAPSQRFSIGVSGAYTGSKYKDYVGTAYVLCATNPTAAGCTTSGRTAGLGFGTQEQDFSGEALTMLPKFAFSLHSEYVQPLDDGHGRIRVTGVFSYSDKYFYSPDHLLSEPSHHLLSGSIGWESENKKYNLTILGDNLLNQKYYIIRAVNGTGGVQFPAMPISWGIRAGVKF